MVGSDGGLRTGGDASNLRIREEAPKVVKHCLKSALIAEIGGIKVPKESNLRPFAPFH
jgi:hypothetical protein